MRWGLNSYCCPMVGMVINLIVGVYIPIIKIPPSKGGMTIPNIGSLDPGTYTYTMHGSYESPIAQGTNVFDGLGTTDGRMANGHGFLDCWVWLFYRENERRKEPSPNTHFFTGISSGRRSPPILMGSEPPFIWTLQLWVWKRLGKDRWHRPENQFWSVTRNHPSKFVWAELWYHLAHGNRCRWCRLMGFFCLPTTSGRSFVKYILFVESMPFLKIPCFCG